jgi:uncharacterized protein
MSVEKGFNRAKTVANNMIDSVRKRPVLAFFAFTYVYSWILWTPLLAIPVDIVPGESDALIWVGVILMYLGGFGPLVGAAVVVKVAGGDLRTWVSQIVKWRVDRRWWLVALGLPIVATIAVSILYILFDGPHDIDTLVPILFYIPLLLFAVVLSGGLNEEPGWRGLALPLLQERYSALTSSLIIGVVWAVWHLPLFFTPVAPHSDFPLVSQILYFPAVVVWSILLTWVYNGTASVLLVMFLHAGLNTAGAWIPIDPEGIIIDGVVQEAYVGLISALNLGVYLLIAVLVIAVFGWR